MKVNLNVKAGNQPLLEIVKKGLNSVPYDKVSIVESIFEKTENGGDFEVTDEEFKLIFSVFLNILDAKAVIAFKRMTEELNDGFSLFEYEQSVKNTTGNRDGYGKKLKFQN